MSRDAGAGPAAGAATPVYLSLADLLQLCADLGDLKVRDVGLLDSAAHRPASAFGGQDAYPTLAGKAAALLQSVVMNHALVDGNKRLGLHLTDLFLYINGAELTLTQDEAVELIVDVAKGVADLDEIERRLKVSARP